MAPGGIYARQGGVPGNPYAYELLPSIVGHTHHMAAYCGVCIYQGNQFPDTYRGHVFMGNIHQSAINHDRLTPNGSSFKAAAESDFLTTTDGWFRPVSEKVGPDGALWIADWYDKYPCYQNAQADPEGVDRQYGRIWRVVYAGGAKRQLGSRPEKNMDLGKLKDEQLVKLLEHPNIWHRRMAQRILGERSDHRFNVGLGEAAIHSRLKQLVLHGETLETCLAALWTLHQVAPVWNWDAFNKTAGVRPDFLAKVLSSNESAIRAWAVKLSIQDLARLHRQSDGGAGSRDAKERGHELFSWLSGQLERLGSDPDPSVRLAVATAIRQIVSSSLTVDSDIRTDIPTGRILTELIKSSSDAKDPLLPFMIWMAGEPSLAANPAGGLSWLAENGARTMPLSAILTRKAMRRICETQEPGKLDLAVDFLRTITEKDNALALAAMDGLLEGQKARPLVPGVDTKSLFDRLSATSNPELKERGQELGTLWGNAAAIQADLGAINDLNSTDEQRIKAIQSAKVLKNGAVRSALVKVIHNPNPDVVVIEAIRALGQIGAEDGANDFLGAWKSFTAPARAAAADTLTSRRRWAMALLSAIEAKIVSIGELPMTSIRALAGAKEDFMRDRAAQVIGRVRPANADKQKIIEQKKKMILAGGPPDLQAGHELAKKTCFVCHRLYGEGAEVGPDLTGVGRSTLDALLANVIDPNQVIGKGYENVDVETRDGRNVAGRLIENTDTRVKLLSSGPREDVIAKSDIQSMRVSEVSVMPEGLEQMPDADFRNLILYVLQPPREQKGP